MGMQNSNKFISLSNPLFEEEFEVVPSKSSSLEVIPTPLAASLPGNVALEAPSNKALVPALNAQQLALATIKERACKMRVDNKMLLPLLEVLDASPGPLVLVSSEQDNQFTEVVKKKKKKIVERIALPNGGRGRNNLPDCFNKLCKNSKSPPKSG